MTQIITQVINTIQGEGVNSGVPITLVRFGNCNLKCSFCDTKWSNNLKWDKYLSKDEELIFPQTITDDIKDKCLQLIKDKNSLINHLLITGGEPLLNQDLIIEIIKYVDPIMVEFETNGTIFPEKIIKFRSRRLIFNISPKLNSRFYKSKKINNFRDIVDLMSINREKFYGLPISVFWKFVYVHEDKEKIKDLIFMLNLMKSEIIIMPLTPNIDRYKNHDKFIEDYKQSCLQTLDFCLKNNYRFSPRLQTWLFSNLESKLNECEDVRFFN